LAARVIDSAKQTADSSCALEGAAEVKPSAIRDKREVEGVAFLNYQIAGIDVTNFGRLEPS